MYVLGRRCVAARVTEGIAMTSSERETIRLLNELKGAMEELKQIWDGIEKWSEEHLEPLLEDAA